MFTQELVLHSVVTYVDARGFEVVEPLFKTHFSDGKWSFVLHVKHVTQDEVRDSIEGHGEGHGEGWQFINGEWSYSEPSMVRIDAQAVEVMPDGSIEFGQHHVFPLVEDKDEAELALWVKNNWRLCH